MVKKTKEDLERREKLKKEMVRMFRAGQIPDKIASCPVRMLTYTNGLQSSTLGTRKSGLISEVATMSFHKINVLFQVS